MKIKNILSILRAKITGQSFVELPERNPAHTKFEVDNWLLSEFVVKKLVPIIGVIPYPLNELMLMSAALMYYRPHHIYEWGTHYGSSARIFYETRKYFRLNCSIDSIDLPEGSIHVEYPKENYARYVKGIKEIRLHRGDGLTLSLEMASNCDPGNRVLFFVDGDHSYEVVLEELSNIAYTFPSAMIIVHDTFYQSEDSGYNIGPYRAVRAFLEECCQSYQLIETRTGLPGMSLLISEENS